MRDVRFRRALSLGINRHEINEVVYFGLAQGVEQHGAAAQSAVPAGLPRPRGRSTTSRPPTRCSIRSGLTAARRARPAPPARRPADGDRRRHRRREHRGNRRAGADPRQLAQARHRALLAAVAARGVPQARVLRQVDDVGLVRAQQRHPDLGDEPATSSRPPTQEQLQWPMWGQYYENNGKGGEAPALPEATGARQPLRRVAAVAGARPSASRSGCGCSRSTRSRSTRSASSRRRCSRSWRRTDVRNVPTEGLYSWDPGSYFGIYHPDTFWFDTRRGPR